MMSEQRGRTGDFIQSQYEKGVFVSYAWGGESERTVDELELAFAKRGIRIVRDKKDLGYKGSIETFEQRIAQGQCVVLVISNKYLRSEQCMYELLEADKKRGLRERIFPIVLADARIYKPVNRLKYIEYWDAQIKKLDRAIRERDEVMTDLDSIMASLKKYKRIRDSFDRLTDLLSDMNALTPETHKQGDYKILVDAIVNVLSKDLLWPKKIMDRRLDAAMPRESQVGQRTEVRVLIPLHNSEGLQAFLPDYTESGELIAKGDVKRAPVPIDFPYDQITGQFLPAHLYVEIDAPDFQVNKRTQQILVPPDKDSGMLTFFLTPRRPLAIGRVSVKLYLDKDCTIALGSVTLTTTVSSQSVEGIVSSWQLAVLALASFSTLITPDPTELVEAPHASQYDDNGNRSESLRPRRKLSVQMKVALVGAAAIIIAAFIGIFPAVLDRFTTTPVPLSSTPACVSADDILVRFHVSRDQQRIATLAPFESIVLEPDWTVDLQVEIRSVSNKPLPTLDCAWKNTDTATDGKLLHQIGCNVDYQSGNPRIVDTLSLQLSQSSCSTLPPYAFFISGQ